MPGVAEVQFERDKDQLRIVFDMSIPVHEVMKNIYRWIGKIPEVCEIHQIGHKNEQVLSLVLQGLNCASCASKIEKRVKSMEGVKEAQFNFASKKFVVQLMPDSIPSNVSHRIENLINELEPGVKVETSHIDKPPLKFFNTSKIFQFGAGMLFLVLALFFYDSNLRVIFYFCCYGIFGWQVLMRALRNIKNREWFNEYFLMSIATLGALAIKEYPEAVAVMLLFWIGEQFQQYAVQRSRSSIQSLINLRPDKITVMKNNEQVLIRPEEVSVGDVFILKPGDRVPVDATIIEGQSNFDLSALSGESAPVLKKENHSVLSGAINLSGLLKLRADQIFCESTISRIMQMVESASSKKAKTEQLITRLSRAYTPIVVGGALVLALFCPWIFPEIAREVWLYRAFVFLVISCPCALVISIPLSFFAGLGRASKEGILIKGSNYLEALNQAKMVLFDKTGTLTQGQFKVSKIYAQKPYDEKEVLAYAALAEQFSAHPYAFPILQAYPEEPSSDLIKDYHEYSGLGVTLLLQNNKKVYFGKRKLLEMNQIPVDSQFQTQGSGAFLAIDDRWAGYIELSDEIKPEAKYVVSWLKKWGIHHIGLLTGDQVAVAKTVANQLQLNDIHAELMPAQKVELMVSKKQKLRHNERLIFVGDGLNDAPVIAQADIGIAMGGFGSDAAIEAADLVIMQADLKKIPRALIIARSTRNVVWQNIAFALGVKVIVLALGAMGYAGMWEAVFADVGVTLLAVINALRILYIRR